MPTPFIPNRDADFDLWLHNFAGLISADPSAYGLSAGDGAEVAGAYATWNTAYTVASAPGTRTGPSIVAKDVARAAAVVIVRRLAGLVRANAAVPESLKLALGVRTRGPGQSRTPVPTECPSLSVIGLSPAAHDLIAGDHGSGPQRAKPRGAAALLVVRTIADTPAKDPNDAAFLTLATRNRFTSRFDVGDGGKIATYFARWANSKGQLGPWSGPVWMQVAA